MSVPRLLGPVVTQHVIHVTTVLERLVLSPGRHQHFGRRRDGQYFQVTEILTHPACRNHANRGSVFTLTARFTTVQRLLSIVTKEAHSADKFISFITVYDIL